MKDVTNFFFVNELLVTYGSVLTAKQKQIMDEYYHFNLAIQEIADNHAITKSAVSDALKVATERLIALEAEVGHIAYKKRIKALLAKIKERIDDKEVRQLLEKEEKDGI